MLAIGISYENEGFSATKVTDLTDAEKISALLQEEFGMCFDEIIVVTDAELVDYWREADER